MPPRRKKKKSRSPSGHGPKRRGKRKSVLRVARSKVKGVRTPRRSISKRTRQVRKKGKQFPVVKRPWYDRLKDPAERAHWRVIDAQWQEDVAREAAEREIRKDEARAFKIVKWHQGITGRGARLLSAVVGREVYEGAEIRYGGDLLKRAASKLEAIRKDREKIRKVALKKIQAALILKGFTMEEVERFQTKVHPRPKVRVRHWHLIRYGRYKNKWEEIVHTGRGPKRVRIIKTRRGLEQAKVTHRRRKRAAEVAAHLGLTFTQARELVRGVETQAVIDLHKLKKTKGFKDLPPRKKAAYTERRWKAGSVAVLYALADIEGYR